MATREVILLKRVPKLGKEGDCVSVKAGYARNYLTVRKIAVIKERANRKQVEALIRNRAIREANEKAEAEALAKKIAAARIIMTVRTGEQGKLFGSVSAKEIVTALEAQGISIDRDALHLPQPIRELGQHRIDAKLHPEVTTQVIIEVVSENPIV
ncbi:MAG: 50S ribosomal protein L9 [Puniceicoccales bacterium]|jgi:large subunit ribosomal protein L9|nr:50S ribosomal protein L9 [Puniceicoccales bacterium]